MPLEGVTRPNYCNMRTEEFDYSLPAELIAQHPAGERTASRLLVLDRRSGTVGHRRFRDHGLPQGRRPHRAERDEGHACAAYGDQGDGRGGRYTPYREGRREKMVLPRLRPEARCPESAGARGRDARSTSSRRQTGGRPSSRTAPAPQTLWRRSAACPFPTISSGRRTQAGTGMRSGTRRSTREKKALSPHRPPGSISMRPCSGGSKPWA